MPKSRTNPNRKQNVLKYKQSKKAKSMSNNQQQLPEVRNVPVWKSTETLEMNGLEFQEIFNFLNNINGAYMAAHSILNRNIMNGKVGMQFEKLNAETGQYELLTGEDAKPYEDEFNKMVEAVKTQAESQPTPAETEDQEGKVERLDALVGPDGQPIRDEDRGEKPKLTVVP